MLLSCITHFLKIQGYKFYINNYKIMAWIQKFRAIECQASGFLSTAFKNVVSKGPDQNMVSLFVNVDQSYTLTIPF